MTWSMRSPAIRLSTNRRRRGTGTVEFAIIGSLFFLLVFAVIELGRGIMVVDQLNSAAVQGVRVGTLQGASSTDIKAAVDNVCVAMSLVDSSGNSLGIVKVYDNGTLVYDSSNSGLNSAVTFTSDHIVKVEVSVPIGRVTWMPNGKFLGSSNGSYLIGHASMIAE